MHQQSSPINVLIFTEILHMLLADVAYVVLLRGQLSPTNGRPADAAIRPPWVRGLSILVMISIPR